MQYMFWQIVVIGGLFTNKPLSAKLLTNSLSMFGKEPNDLVIEDEENSKTKDILSTTLNNLGVASSKYGVIKVYDVEIKFETKEGEF